MHEIAYDTTGFVHKIITYPDLACVCGLDQILKEINQILQFNETGQLLSYDTIFQLRDFYVSALLLQHTIFEEKPCIPVMFLIHERKCAATQQVLFQEAVRHIPSIKSTSSCYICMCVCLLVCAGIYNKHIATDLLASLGAYHLKVAYLNARIEVEDLALISTRSPDIYLWLQAVPFVYALQCLLTI